MTRKILWKIEKIQEDTSYSRCGLNGEKEKDSIQYEDSVGLCKLCVIPNHMFKVTMLSQELPNITEDCNNA